MSALGRKLIVLVEPPKGYAHIFGGTRIEWGDLWFRPCDCVWVEVGAALVGRLDSNPSMVCVRRIDNRGHFVTSSRRMNFLKRRFDNPFQPCNIPRVTTTKLYNIGAYGIPANVLRVVCAWDLNLRWTSHARSEAIDLINNLGLRAEAFSVRFIAVHNWEIVEVEVDASGAPVKVVARRPVADSKWSLVLVIKSDGTVKTCWANLTTDKHRTLDQSKYSKV